MAKKETKEEAQSPKKEAPDKQTDRKFRALFHGDEINGKHYAKGAGITGLDLATSTYLTQIGRIAEVSDDVFEGLEGPMKVAAKKETKGPPKAK